MVKRWAEEWVVRIEDVTERAREMKQVLDEDEDVGWEELREMGLVPEEKVFDEEVPVEMRRRLGMNVGEGYGD